MEKMETEERKSRKIGENDIVRRPGKQTEKNRGRSQTTSKRDREENRGRRCQTGEKKETGRESKKVGNAKMDRFLY